MSKKNVTAIVLAGGKSSRMGSDKALLLYKNKTFLEHVVCAIKPLVDDIIIISNNKEHQVDDCTTIPDLILNSGPIAGIYTGLKHTKTENNLVLSCDIPLVKTSILELIIKNNEPNKDVVQIIDNRNSMPLIALYKKRLAPYFLSQLNKGQRRLMDVISNLKTKEVFVKKEENAFLLNINTENEFKTLKDGIIN
tara:strand:+ start:46 stop:627 length:582 start_codon:yes stop_codon:yes gene_type:complete